LMCCWKIMLEFRAHREIVIFSLPPPVSFGAGKHNAETTKLSNIYILIQLISMQLWLPTSRMYTATPANFTPTRYFQQIRGVIYVHKSKSVYFPMISIIYPQQDADCFIRVFSKHNYEIDLPPHHPIQQ